MEKLMETGYFAIIKAHFTRASGRMTFSMDTGLSCGTLIASNTRVISNRVRKQAKANLNSRDQHTRETSTKDNFTATVNIISLTVGKSMLANLLKINCKEPV
jgi:hypothetical protein